MLSALTDMSFGVPKNASPVINLCLIVKGCLKYVFAIAVCTLTANWPATGQLYGAPGRQDNRAGTFGTSAVTAKHLGSPGKASRAFSFRFAFDQRRV